MILNRTNCKTIASIYKTPFVEQWRGKSITLFVSTTKLKGEDVECLRIRNATPSLPELKPDSPKWKGAIDALKNSSVKIEQIEKQYTISKENRELLLTAAI
jgi:hypothetical protein